MKRLKTLFFLLLSLFILINCSSSNSDKKNLSSLQEQNFSNNNNKREHIKLKEILSFDIKPLDDVKESELIQPRVVVMDSKGFFYIYDSHDMTIKKYDPKGKYLSYFGGKGGGPGEFERAYKMGITPDDKIVVHDMRRGFNFFNSDGTFIEFKKTPSHQESSIRGFKIAENGKFYIETHTVDWSGKKDTLYKISEVINNFTETVVLDSAYINDNKYIREPVYTNVCQPFPPMLYWDIDPITSNIVTARSGDYTIKIFAPNRELLKKFKHRGKQVRVLDKDKEEFYKGLSYSRDGVVLDEMPKYIKKNTKFPDFKPFFFGLNCDLNGNICIYMRSASAIGKYNNDYFSINGNFVGEVTFPLNRWNIFHNKIVVFTYNEDGLKGVSVYTQQMERQ